MEVTLHGKMKNKQKEAFYCEHCGCLFSAESKEYREEMNCHILSHELVTNCPECLCQIRRLKY